MTNLKRHLGALAAGIAATALIAGAALADPALIYDGGGKFDKSFNEAAYTGAEQYKKETGGAYGDLEISGDAQREQAIRQFAQKGFSPIVVPGFSWATALTTVAAEFPDTHFVIIDSVVDLPNVRSVVFKEQEGSYLVGILAAMASKTGTIGVVPAFNFDLLEAFACGYKQGAHSVKPDVKVLETYVGAGFDAFNDPGKATEVAKSQIDQGADVVYQVAGGAGAGVLQAAADAGEVHLIGVHLGRARYGRGEEGAQLPHVPLALAQGEDLRSDGGHGINLEHQAEGDTHGQDREILAEQQGGRRR